MVAGCHSVFVHGGVQFVGASVGKREGYNLQAVNSTGTGSMAVSTPGHREGENGRVGGKTLLVCVESNGINGKKMRESK